MQRGKGRGTEVCYNVQTAVDAQHQLIVACEVTNAPGDRAWLRPMALQAKAGLGCGCAAVADVGYDHGHAVKAGLEAGITSYVPRPITSAHEKLGLCSPARYDPRQEPGAGKPHAGSWAGGAG